MKTPLINRFYSFAAQREDTPPEHRDEYENELLRIEVQSTRVLALLGFTLVPASAVLDYYIYPEHLGHFLCVRAAMSLSCLAFLLLSYIKSLHRFCSTFSLLSMFSVGGGIAYMVRVLGYDDPYYAGLNLTYLALIVTPWGLRKTLFGCLVVYSFYLIPILLLDLDKINFPMFVNNNVFQLETIVIASVVNHFQAIRRKNEIINRLTIAHQAKELEEIDKFKREFIANITHELKTPLAIVMGNADLIMDETGDPKVREGIELIRKAAFQLANHVDRIIAVSNVDDPDAKPDFGNYDYLGVVQNVFDLFESRARAESITYALKLSQHHILHPSLPASVRARYFGTQNRLLLLPPKFDAPLARRNRLPAFAQC